jgi:hypothetical protein
VFSGKNASRSTHTVPYGMDLFRNAFQAVNCLATIIQSLRDMSSRRSRRCYSGEPQASPGPAGPQMTPAPL